MKRAIIFLLLIACTYQIRAQHNYVITHLDNTTGLANNSVNGVYEDSDKLLWLNTYDGLDVYNGISFYAFNSNQSRSLSSLVNSVVTRVREDAYHHIWIGTEEGITKYDKLKGSMTHYFYNGDKDKLKKKSADYILAVGSGKTIICGLRLDTVLYNYDFAHDTMVPIKFDQASVGKIAKIELDDHDRLWTLSFGGILRLFEKRGEIYHQLRIFNNSVNIFELVNHRVFFAVTDTKLFEITKDFEVLERQKIQHFVSEMQYFQGHYFITWQYNGIQEYDGNFKPVDDLLRSCPDLKNVKVNSLTETAGNTLWVSTDDKGVFKIKRQPNTFGLDEIKQGSLLSESNVQAIQQVENELWLGTKYNGIIKEIDPATPQSRFEVIKPVNSSFDKTNNSYYTIKKGFDGNFYIGSDAYGITIYDPVSKSFTKWLQITGTQLDADFFRTHAILPQKDSSIYVGYNGGLARLKVEKLAGGKFKLVNLQHINIGGHFLRSGNNLINALLDVGDQILIGYRFAGLCLLDKQSGKTVNLVPRSDKANLNNIHSLFWDTRHRVWVGTSNGLYWINKDGLVKSKPDFHQITTETGLPNNNVQAILEDDAGNIWVSTNHGLAKINGSDLQVIQYNVEDGLQNAEFSDNSAFKDSRGALYFSGIAGLNHFNPAEIAIDKNLSNLLVTDLNIAGKTSDGIQLMVIKPRGDEQSKDFQLLRNENYFNLKVQPADGYTNIKFQYRCLLKGYDTDWRELRSNPDVNYNDLPPGDYNFYIKWSNGQGEWSDARKVFHVEIRQYIWLTTVAKVIYGLIVLGLIYIYYRITKGRQDIKNKLMVENLIRVKEKKLYQEKMDFFTNITHELQTPLTLILGSIERFFYKNDAKTSNYKGGNFLQIANQEAFRLQYRVHQLLQFRKAESGHLTVHSSAFNISGLLEKIVQLFEPISEKKTLHLDVTITPDILINSDKDKIEMIVFNLLSNAFKYTRPNGSIEFCVAADASTQTLKIMVANSDYDGPADQLHLLFEQFYTLNQSDDTKISSGIGLAFCKQLVELLGGGISVKVENQWIYFEAVLPLNLEAGASTAYTEPKSLVQPSSLVEAAIGAQQVMENRVTINNDLALIEDLSNSEKKTVLIIEDEPSIRHLLREILQETYIVYEAENGQAALDILKKIIPNLILSDVLMDKMDGLKLCSIIKNTLETCHIPFVLLSALSSADQRVDGYEAGADAYIAKPFTATELLNKIKQLIEYHERIQMFFKKDDQRLLENDAVLKADDKTFLNRVVDLINENISNPDFDASYLETALAMTKMTFYRKIKAFTNMTPFELIKHLRLKYAALLLRSTSLTVSEVYYQTGFNNQSHFYREFKKVYMCSPKEYREQNQLVLTGK
ncbi:Two component regulator propeller [Mucilaginibacter gossypiicola]|uniref:histidine kinase n=1 Tax=Mucilaginibacter gossypiicola TaxID=551995 RepID=A0A1H8BNP0_9SPHI|nr:hybrid sensor histidine kinase/response regulator transcription factor [Mucilaginibacter gossypiicola]SEM84465.1 Two component regulator propeller [Mucilaginibacter gossypiicola]